MTWAGGIWDATATTSFTPQTSTGLQPREFASPSATQPAESALPPDLPFSPDVLRIGTESGDGFPEAIPATFERARLPCRNFSETRDTTPVMLENGTSTDTSTARNSRNRMTMGIPIGWQPRTMQHPVIRILVTLFSTENRWASSRAMLLHL